MDCEGDVDSSIEAHDEWCVNSFSRAGCEESRDHTVVYVYLGGINSLTPLTLLVYRLSDGTVCLDLRLNWRHIIPLCMTIDGIGGGSEKTRGMT